MIELLSKLSRFRLRWESKAVDAVGDGEYTGEENRAPVEKLSLANVLGSMDKDYPGFHRLVLDIDHEAALIHSSTPGHYHLIIDQLIPESQWIELLHALDNAGVIETGYANASIRRGQSFIRAPWAPKVDASQKATEMGWALHSKVMARENPVHDTRLIGTPPQTPPGWESYHNA